MGNGMWTIGLMGKDTWVRAQGQGHRGKGMEAMTQGQGHRGKGTGKRALG